MDSIPVVLEIDAQQNSKYSILFNEKKLFEDITSDVKVNKFDVHAIKHKFNSITIKGNVVVNRLELDGIDTRYFIHHGFTSNKNRGNADSIFVKFYFYTPIWKWYIDWINNDNSSFRQISKDHSGFIPL
mgnify:FL=1|jgi:hypothetical protein